MTDNPEPVNADVDVCGDFDFIIVGSGAGGGPLAARLALAGKRVLVIEAGPNHALDPAHAAAREVSLVPAFHGISTEHADLSWRFFVKHYDTPPTGPDPKWHAPNTADGENETHAGIFYPRAAALGGCTVHNALITIAGPASDWDDLADYLSDDSWRADKMRYYFQRHERNEYIGRPPPLPRSWWARAWDNVRWLFGWEVDYSGGRHGFTGWLHTSVADIALGLTDKRLVKVLKAALWQSKRAGLDRAWTFISNFLRGRIKEGLDPNHSRTQAESPEGVVLVPLAVCGSATTIHHTCEAPFVSRGRRSSPREFLLQAQAARPDKLHIWTDCFVTRVLFEDADPPRAVGVEFLKGKRLYRAHAVPNHETGTPGTVYVKPGGEVILCGGTFNTPQLLMLSGIGDRDALAGIAEEARKQAITAGKPDPTPNPCVLRGRDGQPLPNRNDGPPRVHLPGVGRNLQDRYEVTVISEMKRDFSLLKGATFRQPEGDANPDPHLQEWRAEGTGLYTSNGAVLGIFKRSRQDLTQPDLFIFGIPLPFKGYAVGYSHVGDLHKYFTWTILKAHTHNNGGTVRLRTHHPLDTPEINFHYFNEHNSEVDSANDPDLLALVEGVKFVRAIAGNAWFAVRGEYHPGQQAVPPGNDEQIKNWIRREAWGHHACGTCRMGPEGDAMAVLDSRFRVRGVAGLRVVDASIFPNIPGYFIVSNIYVASEKAADVILEDAQHQTADSAAYPRALRATEAAALQRRRDMAATDPAGPQHRAAPPLADANTWSDDVTGVGLSGGGIRSATFNLGVLQALARNRWLQRIDFLSTVSGGSYIGSFLGRLFDHLRNDPTGAGSKPTRSTAARVEQKLVESDSREIAWLRKHGNYIAPAGVGDMQLNLATFLRNFLSVHFVVGTLLFAVFGLANAIRYGLFDPATTGLGFVAFGMGDLPIGHLVQALLGPFFSPWFVLFELIVLFLVLPRIVAYWVVSQDAHERFQGPPLVLLFLIAAVLLYVAVFDGLSLEPLFLALSLLTTFVHVELAWRRGRIQEQAAGSGGVETQRLRTRNYLTYDLGLALAMSGMALAFAVIDTVGHGLQQIAEENEVYIKAFASFLAALAGLAPAVRLAANLLSGRKKTGPSSTVARILTEQLTAGLLAVVFFTLPLVFYSFAAHAVYQGGGALSIGLGATIFAILVAFILRHPKALTFVNRSSLAQTYGARLARAYLGASNPLRHRPEGADVTEVVPGDDVGSIRDYRPHEAGGPLHLINVTVNQTVDFSSQRGNRDRKGENIAVSCLGLSVGERWHGLWGSPAGGRDGSLRKRPTPVQPIGHVPGTDHPLVDETGAPSDCAEMLSLRQWMAISGAAVGPGRGQQTALGTALLFGLANLRTGYWWDSGIDEAARDGFPRLNFSRRLLYLLPRLFLTQSLLLYEWVARFPGPWERYWYISDGGFFENTGGYELIRRRLPRIILSDASADPTYQFDSFADLVRKVRIDFGASIEPFTGEELEGLVKSGVLTCQERDLLGTFEVKKPTADRNGNATEPSGRRAALFWVRYATAPARPSVLLYLKATVIGDESVDVRQYHASHPDFPHESTADQFFDEDQWESYRKLGESLAAPLCAGRAWLWAIPLVEDAPTARPVPPANHGE